MSYEIDKYMQKKTYYVNGENCTYPIPYIRVYIETNVCFLGLLCKRTLHWVTLNYKL